MTIVGLQGAEEMSYVLPPSFIIIHHHHPISSDKDEHTEISGASPSMLNDLEWGTELM
jgi:hypothetical protein